MRGGQRNLAFRLAMCQNRQYEQVQMKILDISADKLSFDSTASARLREMTVRDSTPRTSAYLVILLVLIAEGSVFVGQPKGVDGVVLGRILGTLDSAVACWEKPYRAVRERRKRKGSCAGRNFAPIINWIMRNPNHCQQAIAGNIARAKAVIGDDTEITKS
jgi:hypothetical protein